MLVYFYGTWFALEENGEQEKGQGLPEVALFQGLFSYTPFQVHHTFFFLLRFVISNNGMWAFIWKIHSFHIQITGSIVHIYGLAQSCGDSPVCHM